MMILLRWRLAVYFGSFATICSMTGCGGPESPAGKHEWSVIETIEAKNRAKKTFSEMEWVTENGYHLVCFESMGHRIWIMLDPREVPYYKQMPKGNYKLTSQQLDRIKESGFASSTVLECLTSHVSGD
jgi:hypothetical protein